MASKRNKEEQRKIIINFIRENPLTTYREIRKKLKIHPERVFKKGIAEAFQLARVKPPRTFSTKTKEEKRKIIIDYIKNNPGVGGQNILKDTKINYVRLFRSIESAYNVANIKYPRRENRRLKLRSRVKLKQKIIDKIREKPTMSIFEIMTEFRVQPYHLFDGISEIYESASLRPIKGTEKRRIKKQKQIVNFIKNNPMSTQREINIACKTHVQTLFRRGIFEAYGEAGISFPYDRIKLYGTALKKIKERAKNFEDKMAVRLSGYGKVNRLVKTKRGIADVVFERGGKKAIIEIKDYRAKEISISQINQLNKYLEDCNCELGIVVCHQKPKKDKFLIDNNKIFVLTESELFRIPDIMGI